MLVSNVSISIVSTNLPAIRHERERHCLHAWVKKSATQSASQFALLIIISGCYRGADTCHVWARRAYQPTIALLRQAGGRDQSLIASVSVCFILSTRRYKCGHWRGWQGSVSLWIAGHRRHRQNIPFSARRRLEWLHRMTEVFTMDEVRLNNGKNGAHAWIAIKGVVYNVTDYLDEVRMKSGLCWTENQIGWDQKLIIHIA